MEIWTANLFFLDYLRGKPGTRSKEMNGFDHRLNVACVANLSSLSSSSQSSFTDSSLPSLLTRFSFGVADEDTEIPMSNSGAINKEGGSYAPISRMDSANPKGRDAQGTWR